MDDRIEWSSVLNEIRVLFKNGGSRSRRKTESLEKNVNNFIDETFWLMSDDNILVSKLY